MHRRRAGPQGELVVGGVASSTPKTDVDDRFDVPVTGKTRGGAAAGVGELPDGP